MIAEENDAYILVSLIRAVSARCDTSIRSAHLGYILSLPSRNEGGGICASRQSAKIGQEIPRPNLLLRRSKSLCLVYTKR